MASTVLDRRLLVVTGKGGVGKTSVAAGLAALAARSGKNTLVCEVDAKGSLAGQFEVGPLRFAPTEVQPRLHAMAMETERSLEEYLRLQLRVPILARVGPLARTFDFVANAAPGVKEVLTIGKLCWEVRQRHYDLVVADAPATGHVVGLLTAPRAISGLVQVGRVREQTRWMVDLLEDPAATGVVAVTTPEEMPVNETIELAGRIAAETAVDLAAVVVNRVLPELFGRGEEELFDRLRSGPGAAALAGAAGPGASLVLDAAGLAVQMRRARAVHLARLREALLPGRAGLPFLYVPERFTRVDGMRATLLMADLLGDEVGV